MSAKFQTLSTEAAYGALRSGPAGLDAGEAARRLVEFGPNTIPRARRRPWYVALGLQLIHFLALLLWLAAGLALFAGLSDPSTGMAALAYAIVGVIVVNGFFSFWQERRAETALEALERLLPVDVVVARGGLAEKVPAAALVPGDVAALEAGDRVPADARVVESKGLRVDNSTLTGESTPQWRDDRPCSETDPLRASNILLAGTSVVSGRARALVVATGADTEFARIASLAQAIPDEPSPLQREIGRISRVVAVFSTTLGVVFFGIGTALGLPFWQNLLFAVGILVANVPEGLLPTVTLALAMASQRMARRNAIVRHLPCVEALGVTTVICTDKTGTLTENRMAVRALHVEGALHDAASPDDLRRLSGICPRFFDALLRCEDARSGGPGAPAMGDPMEVALMGMARAVLGSVPERRRVDEIPFDSDRRRLATVHESPQGPILHVKGALSSLLPLCSTVRAEGRDLPMTAARGEEYRRVEDALGERGLRVLAVADRRLAAAYAHDDLERDLVLLGLVALEDPPRPEVKDAIRRCREAGIRVVMITGDHPRTALAVAREIGLVTSPACVLIRGDEPGGFSDARLRLALDAPEVVFARVAADQKRRIVEALKRKGETVAVTGDGVNDAPALRAADIGIAMGRSGTDVAREASGLVLADDNFATIVNAVEEGRAVHANIRKFLTYILTSNVPEIVPYLAFALFRIPLPLTIIQILAVDLGTDIVPALGLGADPPEPDQMRAAPRPRSERLLSAGVLLRAYAFLGPIEAAAAMAAFFCVLSAAGWTYGDSLAPRDPLYLRATSACLATIVVMQVFNVFLCRSARESVLRRGVRGNRLILVGIAVEAALIALIVYTPPGQRMFGTAPLGRDVWLLALGFGAGMLVLDEIRKAITRRLMSRRIVVRRP